MSIYNLDKIFRPEGICVIGASEKKGSMGWALMSNLLNGGYGGKIFPVNPRHTEVCGLAAYSSVRHVPEPVDLAVIATPIATVPEIIQECGRAGVGGAVIISAGGKEIGPRGREIEERIKHAAEKVRLRIIGPNCLGVVCTETGVNASFASHMPLPGKLAFVSQSGAICTAILDLSLKEQIGFSYFVSIGSMLDVDFGDLVNYLGNDTAVSGIVLYMESLSNFRKFMTAARAVSRIKPIVVLKAGKSAAGARAAASHTGALAGEDDVYDAAFKRCGIVRVQTIEELFDCAELLAKQPHPGGRGLVVITNAGGPGVMAADALATYGLEPVRLNSETTAKLDALLPPFWSRANPIDILGDASSERYRKVVEVCLSAPEVDALLIMMVPQALTDPSDVASSLSGLLRDRRTSVYTVWMGGVDVEGGRQIFNRAGIPTYETPERAIRAFMYMCSYVSNLAMLQEIPRKLAVDLNFDKAGAERIIENGLGRPNGFLSEVESKDLLRGYGIPVIPTQTAESPEEAGRLARQMGFPVALKIYSHEITHKSDAGGVQLNVGNERDVEAAFRGIVSRVSAHDPRARLLGVTVQPMIERPEYELILGSKRDPDFGPVILFGLGGILTEVLEDRAIALPPLNRVLARRLIEAPRIFRLLKGYRNQPAANLELLEEILIRLSELVTDFSEIMELDINPLFVKGSGFVAVDARVRVQESDVPSPLHLVIAPYPGQYEKTAHTKDGAEFFIRPIKPEDAPMLVDLFNSLSPTSVYYRFFAPLKSLSHDMLARFTQIDYDRDMALVAMLGDSGGERMIGVARLMGDPDGKRAEFSIVVGDPWQGRGVGANLLEHLIFIAKDRGVEYLWGIVLPENTTMLAVGRKVGFRVSRVPRSGDYELSIDLGSMLRGESGDRS